MTVRPIIFAAPMVRALLDGRKTQTRRLITTPLVRVKAGDRLYVREAWSVRGVFSDVVEVGYPASESRGHTEYVEQIPVANAVPGKGAWPQWPASAPSIHMPRWASRLWLEVTEKREQRLQQITLGDICDEGLATSIYDFKPVQTGFDAWAELWNSLHTKEGERWEDNPWIVALTFTVHHGNIDAAPAAQEAA